MPTCSKELNLTRIVILAVLMFGCAYGQSTCVNFPANFVPFASISYVTAADSAGDHLVVGVPAPGTLSAIAANIPLPASTNQMFCDAQVQLGPGQFYPNVYVPTAAELSGNFSAFNGLFVNAATNQPYPNGQVPAGQLGNVFAWRIGPAQVVSANQGWSPTGSMAEAREGHASVLLPSGKVLMVGGYSTTGDVLIGELYNPATGAFASAGKMLDDHGFAPTATLLNNGKVLIVGGASNPSAAELYDPVSGQFTSAGQPVYPHGNISTATLLNDGRVLVVGGLAQPGSPPGAGSNSGAETYDPTTGTFTRAGAMTANRNGHTATLLADGRVLVAGGEALFGGDPFDSAEIFDPSTGTFSPTGFMTEARSQQYAVLLSNGKVLVGGGFASIMTSAELFDPATGLFAQTGSMTSGARSTALAKLLSSGQVLVAGGKDSNSRATNSAELYNPATGTFVATGSMGAPRDQFTETQLLDGQVLVTGGDMAICCSTPISSAEIYTPVTEGLVTSQTGLTFRIASGSATPPAQTIAVLSNTATIPWTLSTHTYQGGNWLSVTPTSGSSAPGATPVTLTITASPSGLAAQDYYAAITLTPTDGVHPPISIAIVLSIVPPGTAAEPAVTPSGLLFLGTPGATLKPQSFTISNLTSTAITFNAVATSTPTWFTSTPISGTIPAAQSSSITVTPSTASLTSGVYPGSIKLLFADGSTQTIDLLLVISSTAGTANARPSASPASAATSKATAACTASKLLPVFTTIGIGFDAPAAWPTPLAVQVVDDCGNGFNTGSVIVSFSDGDAPINLLSIGNGNWTGTWTPLRSSTGFSVRADAQALPLTGTVQVSGQVFSNPSVPVISPGGAVSSGDFASSPALGLLVSIFGSGLADGSLGDTGVPLMDQLGSTSVTLSGRSLPLLYVSANQVNVAIPYDVTVNSAQQLVVERGNAVSVPVPLAVFSSEPTILTATGSGSGQGLIFWVDAKGNSGEAVAATPATAGDVLVIYAVGLGAVTPAISVENGAPSTTLIQTETPVTVTIGGVTATSVPFAGLTPGYVGLYQVNVVMPSGVTPGSQVPVTISIGGKSNQGSVYMAVK